MFFSQWLIEWLVLFRTSRLLNIKLLLIIKLSKGFAYNAFPATPDKLCFHRLSMNNYSFFNWILNCTLCYAVIKLKLVYKSVVIYNTSSSPSGMYVCNILESCTFFATTFVLENKFALHNRGSILYSSNTEFFFFSFHCRTYVSCIKKMWQKYWTNFLIYPSSIPNKNATKF